MGKPSLVSIDLDKKRNHYHANRSASWFSHLWDFRVWSGWWRTLHALSMPWASAICHQQNKIKLVPPHKTKRKYIHSHWKWQFVHEEVTVEMWTWCNYKHACNYKHVCNHKHDVTFQWQLGNTSHMTSHTNAWKKHTWTHIPTQHNINRNVTYHETTKHHSYEDLGLPWKPLTLGNSWTSKQVVYTNIYIYIFGFWKSRS